MYKKLLDTIHKEDKKNPLTDLQLSNLLQVSRSEITQLRKLHKIPDSRERSKALIIKTLRRIVKENPSISERTLAQTLKKDGFIISRYRIVKICNDSGIEINKVQSEKLKSIEDQVENIGDSFARIIGMDGSIKQQVKQAKAAVMYPPNGVHTLITGPTGVGKSELAECMYDFALERNGKDAIDFPFITFNCADYAENQQLLVAQLFGYKEGAFTGAISDKKGLVEKANGGILFLDEVHRLPSEGQEILFQLIDKGKYRRLGETEIVRDINLMIIAATSEDISENLLGTFRRRIPMYIEIPPLCKRLLSERLDIIKLFFKRESIRVNKKIVVRYNVIKTLLLYDCEGNIGQLKSDIQVISAKGFLKYITNNNISEHIIVDFPDLPLNVSKGLLNIQWERKKIEELVSNDLVFDPNEVSRQEDIKSCMLSFPNETYKNIKTEYKKLKEHGLPNEVINRIIEGDLERNVRNIVKHLKKSNNKLLNNNLNTIVSAEIIELVREMINIAETEFEKIDDSLFYCLALHLNISIKKIKNGEKIDNEQLNIIKDIYLREYKVASKMAYLSESLLGVILPEEEIGFIAMYLKTLGSKDLSYKNMIGIVIVTHGHVAQGIANVANSLMGVEIVKAVEMSLDEKPEIAFEKTKAIVLQENRGKGVLIFVDMGSLASFGKMITKMTGIVTKTVPRVDTTMVIEALRKVILPGSDIYQIADSLIKNKESINLFLPEENSSVYSDQVIINICLTGKGTAIQIKDIIKKEVDKIDKNIKIYNLGIIDEINIIERIDKIRRKYNIIVIIGTINPKYIGIPFISSVELLNEKGVKKLVRIMNMKYKQNLILSVNNEKNLGLVFNKNFIYLNKDMANKDEVLETMCDKLVQEGYVTEKFIQGVLEREEIGSTATDISIAIPHGQVEDIIYPSISIMTLSKPIKWYEDIQVSVIFLLALNENSLNYFRVINRMIKDKNIIKELVDSRNKKEIFEILERYNF